MTQTVPLHCSDSLFTSLLPSSQMQMRSCGALPQMICPSLWMAFSKWWNVQLVGCLFRLKGFHNCLLLELSFFWLMIPSFHILHLLKPLNKFITVLKSLCFFQHLCHFWVLLSLLITFHIFVILRISGTFYWILHVEDTTLHQVQTMLHLKYSGIFF